MLRTRTEVPTLRSRDGCQECRLPCEYNAIKNEEEEEEDIHSSSIINNIVAASMVEPVCLYIFFNGTSSNYKY